MAWPDPIVLEGQHVCLEPLCAEHAPGLALAVADGDVHRLWFTQVPAPEAMPAEISRRMALHDAGSMLPFAVRRRIDAQLVGMTTYMNIDAIHRRLEIGSTWYSASARRSPVNTECKQLLLRHAFETLGCIAVEFRTHWFNRASRAAIERLGAKQDGVLRNHQRLPDGSLRDTVVYSIIESEWPSVRHNLQELLGQAPHGGTFRC